MSDPEAEYRAWLDSEEDEEDLLARWDRTLAQAREEGRRDGLHSLAKKVRQLAEEVLMPARSIANSTRDPEEGAAAEAEAAFAESLLALLDVEDHHG